MQIRVLLAVDHIPISLHLHPRRLRKVQVLGNSLKRKCEMAIMRREQMSSGEDSNEVAKRS